MKTILVNLWDTVRGSYWFFPAVASVSALMLSLLLPQIDAYLDAGQLPEWVLTTMEAARAILSTIATAMIGVTGTVFSITVVTLSLASQQLGPRLLRTFMEDSVTQVALATFISTGLYSLLLLRVVEDVPEGSRPPHISVLVALVLTVISLFVLIAFIHHIALHIQAPVVIERVAEDLSDALERLFPEHEDSTVAEEPNEYRSSESLFPVQSSKEGYIQAIDLDGLLRLTEQKDFILYLNYRPGDFVTPCTQIAESSLCDKEIESRIDEHFLVGNRRTPRQDFECAINELVEIAVRSLSPGINDPFTAINCIDRLGAILARLTEKSPQPNEIYGKDGKLRLILKPLLFSSVLDTAFHPIRQNARHSVQVTIRIIEALGLIAQRSKDEKQLSAVRRHLGMLRRIAVEFPEKNDVRDVDERIEKVEEEVSDRLREPTKLSPDPDHMTSVMS